VPVNFALVNQECCKHNEKATSSVGNSKISDIEQSSNEYSWHGVLSVGNMLGRPFNISEIWMISRV